MRWIVAMLALCVACKDKQQAPSPTTKPTAAPAESRETPSLPAPAPAAPATTGSEAAGSAKPSKPISVDEASAALPELSGTQIIALKPTSDHQQVHGTWCIDGTSADDVAKDVGRTLGKAKYGAISIRGDARKAGVMADRDGIRFSMVVSASSAAVCAAPAHYFASATIFKL